jgi:predicted alpha/beta superfamily hydrolase
MKEYRTIRFYSEQLKKHKRVYVYLPENYDVSEDFYPVLYMHDGQNLFDDQTAHHKRSWRILDELEQHEEWKNKLIIVGIESDQERTDELIPYTFQFSDDDKTYGGKADLYLDFITMTVKPLIDKRFRTFKNRNNTAIMGSSFGGVNSFYAALQYAHVFSRFGCVSNAFHYGFYEQLKERTKQADLTSVRKLYLDFGTKETSSDLDNQGYIDSNKAMYELVSSQLDDEQVSLVIVEGGKHHERDWQKRFIDVLSYLFTD